MMLAALPVNSSIPLCALTCFAMRRWPDASIRLATKMVPPCDANVMNRAAVFTDLVEDARSTSQSAAGAMADDYAIFARPWRFHLEDIGVAVDIWHGDLDQNVPIQHGQDQANRIPHAVFHPCPGEGHFLIFDRIAEILAVIAEPLVPGPDRA
jgi:pimeloyl-ACP methyl ester carboxylesterase